MGVLFIYSSCFLVFLCLIFSFLLPTILKMSDGNAKIKEDVFLFMKFDYLEMHKTLLLLIIIIFIIYIF